MKYIIGFLQHQPSYLDGKPQQFYAQLHVNQIRIEHSHFMKIWLWGITETAWNIFVLLSNSFMTWGQYQYQYCKWHMFQGFNQQLRLYGFDFIAEYLKINHGTKQKTPVWKWKPRTTFWQKMYAVRNNQHCTVNLLQRFLKKTMFKRWTILPGNQKYLVHYKIREGVWVRLIYVGNISRIKL